ACCPLSSPRSTNRNIVAPSCWYISIGVPRRGCFGPQDTADLKASSSTYALVVPFGRRTNVGFTSEPSCDLNLACVSRHDEQGRHTFQTFQTFTLQTVLSDSMRAEPGETRRL